MRTVHAAIHIWEKILGSEFSLQEQIGNGRMLTCRLVCGNLLYFPGHCVPLCVVELQSHLQIAASILQQP
jgi:hypothetical protein